MLNSTYFTQKLNCSSINVELSKGFHWYIWSIFYPEVQMCSCIVPSREGHQTFQTIFKKPYRASVCHK